MTSRSQNTEVANLVYVFSNTWTDWLSTVRTSQSMDSGLEEQMSFQTAGSDKWLDTVKATERLSFVM